MRTLTSADGTTIAFERSGNGPAVVIVDGAMCYRGSGPVGLAERLQDRFTVYVYDRRGRGDSTDTAPYAVAREVEDLRAIIAEAGGSAAVYGMSSGAALALAAAGSWAGITRLALYEPPFMAEAGDEAAGAEYTRLLGELLDEGRRGDAVAAFMTRVGVPGQVIDRMRGGPGWPAFEALAPTLAYDDAILNGGWVPRNLTITVPALVIAGGASPAGLRQAAKATAEAIPGAELLELAGQTHDVSADALAPVLAEFLAAQQT